MPNRFNPGCKCCGCTGRGNAIAFRLLGCANCAVVGATVDFIRNGVVVCSTTTNSTGRAFCFDPPNGSYDIEWSVTAGSLSWSGTRTATVANCGSPEVIATLTATAGNVCSSACALPLPDPLYVTDNAGTRAVGECVLSPPNSQGLVFPVRTLFSALGPCANPTWLVNLSVKTLGEPDCSTTSGPGWGTGGDTTGVLSCSRPISASGTYNTFLAPDSMWGGFLIHE